MWLDNCVPVIKIKVKLDYKVSFKGGGDRNHLKDVHVGVAPLHLQAAPAHHGASLAALSPLVPNTPRIPRGLLSTRHAMGTGA